MWPARQQQGGEFLSLVNSHLLDFKQVRQQCLRQGQGFFIVDPFVTVDFGDVLSCCQEGKAPALTNFIDKGRDGQGKETIDIDQRGDTLPAVIKTDLPFEEEIFVKQSPLIDAGIDQVENLLRGTGFKQIVTRA